MKKMFLILSIALFQIFIFALPYILINDIFGFSSTPNGRGYLKILLSFSCNAAGIIASLIYREYDVSAKSVKLKTPITDLLSPQKFIFAAIIAPITYAAIYSTIQQIPDGIVALLFSFENGFFFQSIMSKNK